LNGFALIADYHGGSIVTTRYLGSQGDRAPLI
jgi:hypothetical protein